MKNTRDGRSMRGALLAACVCASVALALGTAARRGAAQSGVLIPSSVKDRPDPALLSLQTLSVDVLIDNQHARVRVLQIFDSHTPQVLEGKYLFALSPRASVSDFAVWDGDTRIPGVMLEKRRAGALYAAVKQQQVDPGLLQQDDEHEGSSAFTAKVFPIPAYGTKRVELEYTEVLPVEGLTSHFQFPLKPSYGDPERAAEFSLHLRILSDAPLAPPRFDADAFPLRAIKYQPDEYEADLHAADFELKQDFALDYRLDVPHSTLSWIAHRASEPPSAYDLRDPAQARPDPDGYFEARALFNEHPREHGDEAGDERGDGASDEETLPPRRVVLMLDTSLSMHGEKLARAVEAIDVFLHGLAPRDTFALLLFNEDVSVYTPAPVAATAENVEGALAFVRGSMLGGGTDLRRALARARETAAALPAGERSVILITDANPTLGTTELKRILAEFTPQRGAAPAARVFAFGVGSDANQTLLKELAAATHGYFMQARETEDVATELQLLFEKVGRPAIEGLRLSASDPSNLTQVYATNAYSFDGSSYAFVGRYRRARPSVRLIVEGREGGAPVRLTREVSLPDAEEAHAHLPRLWARARVDALLDEMNLNGEREDYISEIIRLSQKYKFVTPYTAFLAAPRALLRPRLIQPGDPVIRVRTDDSIKSVFAVLPFGETLPLRFLAAEKLWEGRFLAPAWMPDGTYRCRLLMTDARGNSFQEEKSFVVDSHPPRLSASVEPRTVRAGEELRVRVAADSDTARLNASIYGAPPVALRWSPAEKSNAATLRVPEGLAAGRYVLTVSAEDFAHNQSSVELEVEVLARN